MGRFGNGFHHIAFGTINALPSRTSAWAIAALFDFRFRNTDPWGYQQHQPERDRIEAVGAAIARHIDPRRILELGCAEGALSRGLARQFPAARLHGVDISPTAISRAAALAEPGQTFEVVDVRHWEGPAAGSIDVVVATDLMYYLPSVQSRKDLVCRAARWLDSGGVLVMGHARDRAIKLHGAGTVGSGLRLSEHVPAVNATYQMSVYIKL